MSEEEIHKSKIETIKYIQEQGEKTRQEILKDVKEGNNQMIENYKKLLKDSRKCSIAGLYSKIKLMKNPEILEIKDENLKIEKLIEIFEEGYGIANQFLEERKKQGYEYKEPSVCDRWY